MAVRWQFVEDPHGTETFWTWRVLLLDGTAQTQSQRFPSYGAAVGDAIRNGFRPSRHHWIVVTRYTATHFRPGEQQMAVPVARGDAAGPDVIFPAEERKTGRQPKRPRPLSRRR